MADLTNAQGTTSVEVLNETSGNTLTINSDGSLNAAPTGGVRASYSASTTGLVVAAAATDVFTITGSATKTIRITSVQFGVSTTAGSGILTNVLLIKRSTVNSAGTSTTSVNVPHDSSDAAGTASVKAYTANPTLGTAVGTMRAVRYVVKAIAIPIDDISVDFGIRPSKAVVLRGTSESLCVNLNGITITGPVAGISVEWTEE